MACSLYPTMAALLFALLWPGQSRTLADTPSEPATPQRHAAATKTVTTPLELPVVGKLFGLPIDEATRTFKVMPTQAGDEQFKILPTQFWLPGIFSQPWQHYKTNNYFHLNDDKPGFLRVYEHEGRVFGFDLYWENLAEADASQIIDTLNQDHGKHNQSQERFRQGIRVDDLVVTISFDRNPQGPSLFRVWVNPIFLYIARHNPPRHIQGGLLLWKIVPGMTMEHIHLVHAAGPHVQMTLDAQTKQSQTYSIKMFGVIEDSKTGRLVDGWKTTCTFVMVDGEVDSITYFGKPSLRANLPRAASSH